MATERVKRIVVWVVFAFLVYSVISDPHHSAIIVRNIGGVLTSGVQHIGDFFRYVLHS